MRGKEGFVVRTPGLERDNRFAAAHDGEAEEIELDEREATLRFRRVAGHVPYVGADREILSGFYARG